MLGRLSAKLPLTTAMFGLTACGGSAGSEIASLPPPPPTPTPTPTPTPAQVSAKIFPDLTTSTDFAVLGLYHSDLATELFRPSEEVSFHHSLPISSGKHENWE